MASYRARKQREHFEKYGVWKPYRPGNTKIVSRGAQKIAPRESELDKAKTAPRLSGATKPKGYDSMLQKAQGEVIKMQRPPSTTIPLVDERKAAPKNPVFTQSQSDNTRAGGGNSGSTVPILALVITGSTLTASTINVMYR